jgi:hypothetical protein
MVEHAKNHRMHCDCRRLLGTSEYSSP